MSALLPPSKTHWGLRTVGTRQLLEVTLIGNSSGSRTHNPIVAFDPGCTVESHQKL